MKMVLTSAKNPDEYIKCLSGWQRNQAAALRSAVREAAPELEERLKWGHIVYFMNGPVLLIRAEPTRVLFGFWRGQRLRHIEPRLKPGGKYEMATLELKRDTPLLRGTVTRLASEASALNRLVGGAPSAASTCVDVDQYIAAFAPEVRAVLQQVRQVVCAAAPEAREVISYQMPALKQHGVLVYFAAFKNHIGFYPPITGDARLEKAASRYAGEKGNLRFPLDEPMPYELIEGLTRLRAKQDGARARATANKKRAG